MYPAVCPRAQQIHIHMNHHREQNTATSQKSSTKNAPAFSPTASCFRNQNKTSPGDAEHSERTASGNMIHTGGKFSRNAKVTDRYYICSEK